MRYKWKPNATQRRAFAEKMKDPAEEAAYNQRKIDRANKRREGSKFDYSTAGGSYIATRDQWHFCLENMHLFKTIEEEAAASQVTYSFACQEKIHHDYIHIVNEVIRNNLRL